MLNAPGRLRSLAILALAATFVALCLYPHLLWVGVPSLFSDDVIRVMHLRMLSPGVMLVRPFNEHMAPLFEAVSLACWRLVGRRLTAIPAAFEAASLLPFVLCLLALGRVVRREVGSTTTALAAVATFSLSAMVVEAVHWYSASSFTWALLGCLVALDGSGRGRWPTAFLAALAAPAFSAIGLLAGPLGALRALLGLVEERGSRRRAILEIVAPTCGSIAYLGLASVFRYRDVLSESVRKNVDLPLGLLSTARAPIDVLIPGLFGLGNIDNLLPPGVDLFAFAIAAIASIAWAFRSRQRPLILGGLLLILGGYGLTYPFRTVHGPHWILEVQRYHLFPQLGLVLLLAPAAAPFLKRFDARPVASLAIASGLAALLLWSHLPEMKARGRKFHFPDQPRTLAALERLDAICRAEGITRDQALAALDPVRTAWFPHEYNALMMLPPSVAAPRLPDDRVRPTLLAALAMPDREGLCGGLDASKHLRPNADYDEETPASVGRPVGSFRIVGSVSKGGPAYREYLLAPAKGPAEALSLPIAVPGEDLEVWWADRRGRWSETRSIRLHADAASPPQGRALPLEWLPHWDPAESLRLRLFSRSAGPIAAGEPRLLRGKGEADPAPRIGLHPEVHQPR